MLYFNIKLPNQWYTQSVIATLSLPWMATSFLFFFFKTYYTENIFMFFHNFLVLNSEWSEVVIDFTKLWVLFFFFLWLHLFRSSTINSVSDRKSYIPGAYHYFYFFSKLSITISDLKILNNTMKNTPWI